ncbi:filamin/ABP280 repeat domain-containing protein [Rhodohalobacter sp. 8-1]|uniref:filamin/ABP280 repeat domain-containing protein n=1 Tax=Rhodohalobacter sp. 8-1 TaxID=3131972 RepID=UPI0030EF3DF4
MFSCDTTNPSFDDTIPEVYFLDTRVVPAGMGLILVNPIGDSFEANERVTLEAIPNEGYVFEKWEGALVGNTNPESIIIDDDKSITAHFFLRNYPLNILISGEGNVVEVIESRSIVNTENQEESLKSKSGAIGLGQVSTQPPLQTADPEANENSRSNTTVKLRAEPAQGWYFSQWEGDLTGDVNPEVITVDEEKNVTAVFLQEESEGFTIEIEVIGEGDVNKSPDRTFFNEGDELTLTANPDQGWSFVEWHGDLTGMENSQTVTVDKDLSVTALFEVSEDPGLAITRQPTGSTAGVVMSPSPRVLLVDGLGDPIPGVEIGVSLNVNSFAQASTLLVNTDVDGVAVFDNLTIEKAASNYILTFNAEEVEVLNISSNPFGVAAADVIPSKTSATVPDGGAGRETVISILARDEFDNLVPGIADGITVEVSGDNSASPVVVEGDNPGEYRASYVPENSGTDKVSIQVGGVLIAGSPFESQIGTSEYVPSNSTATVSNGTAGDQFVISISVRDQFDNSVSGVAEDLTVNVMGANSATPTVSETSKSGEYTASYTPENAGTDRIAIQLGGEQIKGSPFRPNVSPAAADPANSTAEVSEGVAGQETTITIFVNDRFGNSIVNVEDELSVQVTGANSRTPSVTETSVAGQYRASYNPVNSGTDQVSIQLGGEPINGSPFESEVATADPDPSNSTATVPDGVAGEATEITILVRDQFGNGLSGVTEELSVTVSGTNSADPSVNDGSTPGEYNATYVPETAGVDQVVVQLGGELIQGSPFESTVTPSSADPSNSSATVPDGVAGEETLITIFAKDSFGNSVSGIADEFTVNISGANSTTSPVSAGSLPGEYSAVYLPEASGVDQIEILLGGISISESPFESSVAPATGDPSSSSATVADGVAGQETVITIRVRDRFGNNIRNASDDLSVVVSGGNSVAPSVSEGGSAGLYTASYIPEIAGKDQIAVQLDGEPIDGSPFESDVSAASVDPSNSTLSADPDELTVGEVSIVKIELLDRFSNKVMNIPGTAFTVSVNGDATAGSIEETSDKGFYSFDVTSTNIGDVEISVSVGGIKIEDDASIEFEAGAPEELTIITQPEDSQSGEAVGGPPAVRVWDGYGNPVSGVDVTVREVNGAEFFDSTLTVITNESGIATFNNLVLNRFFGNFRLIFLVDGTSEVTSEIFQVNPFINPD